MNRLFALIITLVIALPTFAQKTPYTIPAEYSFSTDGFKNYEITMIECVNWLENSPLDQDEEKRSKAVKFMNDWLDGSPDVNIELNDKIMIFSEKNPILTDAFKGGWARLVIKDSERAKDVMGCNLAGIISAMNVYQLRGRKKDKGMESLLKLMKKNELSGWVKTQLGL
ncbi:MAG: hypothetical protein ACI9EQ_001870 [Bacteroidia bacterium]|jgi:hypothetical protein